MSLCDHRIMTENSGYSGWAERLNGNPGAINVVFSEESQEGRVNITKQMVEVYSEREKEPKPLPETSMNALVEIRIAIDEEQDYVKALQCLSRLCFDCKSITPEQYDMLYTYYENILFAREDYVKAEQALIKHLMWNPDSADVNGSMAVVKRLLGKNIASYMFASKACREEQGDGYKQLFHEVFHQDENYPAFVSLCQIPRMHFILCPNAEISFYVKHTDSLAIVLKQLGHEVSLLGSNGIPVKGSYMNEKLVDFCMRKKQEMDSCNVRNISLYHYAEAEEFNVYGDMLRAITKESPLPPVIIGRKLESILAAKEYPMIFWDYTEPLDKESQLIKYYDAWERMDAIMRQAAKAILSTKNAASHAEKTRVLDSYAELKEYSLEAEKYFCTNYIEEDCFLNFAYETVKLATKCI